MADFNNDELEPPKWMDNEFMLTVLQADQPTGITNLKFTPGTEKGDHYASVMFRAAVEYTTPKGLLSKSLIIKTLPEFDSLKGQLLAQSRIFETEIKMYSETIPKMEAELRKYGDNTQLGAKMLYQSLSPRKIIVFEDLCTKGFHTIRGRFLNMVEAKKMLLLLAKWHAVSYKLASENYESIKKYDQGIFNSSLAESSEFLTGGIKHCIDVISKMEGFEKYAEKLKRKKGTLLRSCIKTFNAYKNGDKTSIMVLNHGDFHMKNAMFKFNGETLEDCLLVDFQICTYAPAIIDIIYSVYMLMNPDLRLNHREELIYYYFESFLTTLKTIEFAGVPPTLADFQIDIIKHRDFETYVVSTFLPLWLNLMQPLDSTSTDNIIQSPTHRGQSFNHPNYINELKVLLPKLLYKGCLD